MSQNIHVTSFKSHCTRCGFKTVTVTRDWVEKEIRHVRECAWGAVGLILGFFVGVVFVALDVASVLP